MCSWLLQGSRIFQTYGQNGKSTNAMYRFSNLDLSKKCVADVQISINFNKENCFGEPCDIKSGVIKILISFNFG